jgi:CubicO group peptidase (beta-lactamase class C family)
MSPFRQFRARLFAATLAASTLTTTAIAPSAAAQAPAPPNTRAILADLDRYIPKALAEWNGAGVAIGIVKDDSLIYAKGFGVREVGKPETVDDRTIFAIGSNTKFFTAVAAGMLVDDGKLSLDDKVTKHLPWFQLYDPWVTREFTMRDAMTHRSGLGRRADFLWYGTPYSRDEVVRRVRYLVPNSSFRTEYGYQNIMFLTAGQVVGAAAGKTWDEFIRERIFEPLGMSASNTSVKALASASNVARPHDLGRNQEHPVPIAWRDLDNAGPAGSINSNVQDMARWMRFILAGGTAKGRALLKPATLTDITSPHFIAQRIVNDTLNPTRHFQTYALGIGASDLHGVKVLSHTGGIDGMLSYVAMVPERKLGIVVLTNVTGHNALYTTVGSRILNAFLGGPARDWSAIALEQTTKAEKAAEERFSKMMAQRPADAKPTHELAAYAGTYRNEMYGDVNVSFESGKLQFHYFNAVTLDLTPFAFDTFLGAPAGIATLTPDALPIRFALDPVGKIVSLDYPDVGTFTRVAK